MTLSHPPLYRIKNVRSCFNQNFIKFLKNSIQWFYHPICSLLDKRMGLWVNVGKIWSGWCKNFRVQKTPLNQSNTLSSCFSRECEKRWGSGVEGSRRKCIGGWLWRKVERLYERKERISRHRRIFIKNTKQKTFWPFAKFPVCLFRISQISRKYCWDGMCANLLHFLKLSYSKEVHTISWRGDN